MEVSPELIASLELAKWPILALPGVVGVGIGLREENGLLFNDLAIRIYVSDLFNLPPGIPNEVGGVGVCFIETNIELRSLPIPDNSRQNVISGGIKIINPGKRVGTLGAVVQDSDTHELLGLSCYHVVGDMNSSFPYTIWQPDNPPLVGPSIPMNDNIGHVKRVDYPRTQTPTFPPNTVGIVDAAVFSLDTALGQGRTLSPKIMGKNHPDIMIDRITSTAVPTLGQDVRKRGFVTRLTEGIIVDVNGNFKWIDGPPNTYLIGQAVILGSSNNADGVFCLEGDSGSVVLDKNSSTAVGLLWGSNDRGTMGFMSHIRNVESRLGVNMVW